MQNLVCNFEDDVIELVPALRLLAVGFILDEDLQNDLVEEIVTRASAKSERSALGDKISDEQRQFTLDISAGATSYEVADEVHCMIETIESLARARPRLMNGLYKENTANWARASG